MFQHTSSVGVHDVEFLQLNIVAYAQIILVVSLFKVAVLLELIDDLLSIVGRGCGQGQEEEEQAVNRQTALYSLKLLCRSFGTDHQEVFLPVLSKTVELVANPAEERNVMSSALLCVAEVTSTLKALAITQVHRYRVTSVVLSIITNFRLL